MPQLDCQHTLAFRLLPLARSGQSCGDEARKGGRISHQHWRWRSPATLVAGWRPCRTLHDRPAR